MLSALIYAEEDGKRENERGESRRSRRGVARRKRERSGIEERKATEKGRGRKIDREDHRSRRIRIHVIGIVDSVLRLSALRRNLSSRVRPAI